MSIVNQLSLTETHIRNFRNMNGTTSRKSFSQSYLIGRGISEGTVNLAQPLYRFALPANEIYNTTSFSDFTNIVNQANGSDVVVIFYHRFADNPVWDTMTNPRMFASEMKYLDDNNFTVMSMSQLFLKQVATK